MPEKRLSLEACMEDLTRSRRLRIGWLRDGALLRSWFGVEAREALVVALDFARAPAEDRAGLFASRLDADVFDLMAEPDLLYASLSEHGLDKRVYGVPDPLAVPDAVWSALGWQRENVLTECAFPSRRKRRGARPIDSFKNIPRRFAWFVNERLLPKTRTPEPAADSPSWQNPPEAVAAWRTLEDALRRVGWSPQRLRDRLCARCAARGVKSMDLSASLCWRCRQAVGAPEPAPDSEIPDADSRWVACSFQPTLPGFTSVEAIDRWLLAARLALGHAWTPPRDLAWAREPEAWREALGWLFYEGHYAQYDADWLLRVATLGAADAFVRDYGFAWDFSSDDALGLRHPAMENTLPVAGLLKNSGNPLPESFPDPDEEEGEDRQAVTPLERAENAIKRIAHSVWPALTPADLVQALRGALESVLRVQRERTETLSRQCGFPVQWDEELASSVGRHIQELAERMAREAGGDGTQVLTISFPVAGREIWTYGEPATGGFRFDRTTLALQSWLPSGDFYTIYPAELRWEPEYGWRVLWDMEKNGAYAEELNPSSEAEIPPVVVAASEGDVATLARLLDERPDLVEASDGCVDIGDGARTTPLVAAAEAGRVEAVRFLLERGAQVYPTRRPGHCPALLRAAKNGHHAVVELLLDHGVPVEPPPAPSAEREVDAEDMVDHLLDKGGELLGKAKQARSDKNDEALEELRGDARELWGDFLEEFIAPPDTTPLYEAVLGEQKEVARLLIARGADVNRAGPMGTVLHIASFYPGMTDNLLAAGADDTQRNAAGQTPLMAAVAMAAMLEKPAAQEDADDEIRKTAEQARESALQFLARGAEVNAADVRGRTSLHVAVESGSVFWVQTLLAHGADAHAKDKDGQSPVDLADARGDAALLSCFQSVL